MDLIDKMERSLSGDLADAGRWLRQQAGDKRVLLAVSGGSDSTGLLCLCRVSMPPSKLVVGFVDHGLREGVKQEWTQVSTLAEKLGVEARRLVIADVTSAGHREGVQQWARKERYRLVEGLAASMACDFICTGHTRDDQAETVLLRILRGAGVQGLGGIPRRRHSDGGVVVLRPLLWVSRQRIRDWLLGLGVGWAEDPSNEHSRYMRVRVRRELLPLMASMAPNINRQLCRLADQSRQVATLVDNMVCEDRYFQRLRLGAGVCITATAFDELPSASHPYLLRQGLRRLLGHLRRFEQVHLDAVLAGRRNDQKARQISLPGEVSCWTWAGSVFLFNGEPAVPREPTILVSQGEIGRLAVADVSCTWTLEEGADRCPDALALRLNRPGDRLAGSKTTFSRFLIKLNIPVIYRRFIPVLAQGSSVIGAPSLLNCRHPGLYIHWTVGDRSVLSDIKLIKGHLIKGNYY